MPRDIKTLVVINAMTGRRHAGDVFLRIARPLTEAVGPHLVAVTARPEEIAHHLDAAASIGISRVIAVGGDGTNHAVVNALAARPDLDIAFGSVPLGTGCDWARTLGCPRDAAAAVAWLVRAKPLPCDIGIVNYADAATGAARTRTLLNVASAGLGGVVDERVNRLKHKSRLSFAAAAVSSIFHFTPPHITVECDGTPFFSGRAYLVAMANGRYFGRGMKIAPAAMIDDGLFDIVIITAVSKPQLLINLSKVYRGTHIADRRVVSGRASRIVIRATHGALPLDFDGEYALASCVECRVVPRALKVLMDPQSDARRHD